MMNFGLFRTYGNPLKPTDTMQTNPADELNKKVKWSDKSSSRVHYNKVLLYD